MMFDLAIVTGSVIRQASCSQHNVQCQLLQSSPAQWTNYSFQDVIAISVFDLMTLNIALRVALGPGIIFTKFHLRQLISA